jgi:two-component system sensor histidine kinase PrrB
MGAPVVLVMLLAEVLTEPLDSQAAARTVAVAVELTTTLCWILLGLQRRRLPGSILGNWGGIGMYLMAATDFLGAVALTGILPPIGFGAGVQLAGAVTLTLAVAARLRAAYREQRVHQVSVSDALAQTSGLLMRLEQVQRERLHDARSAIFGVIGASELLATPVRAQSVDGATLQRLIAAELTRLQEMLNTDVSEPIDEFDVLDVFSPVLLAHQIDGADIQIVSLAGRAQGRPRACATVLDNLLRNARTHAPGATISVTVDSDDELLTIVVEDDGPGIPVAERTAVLLPGVRGSTAQSCGSGLGLHSCLAAMSAQSGSLALGESATGGLRVTLQLPAASRLPQLIAS